MSTGIAKFPIRNNRLRRNPAGNTLSQNAWNCHLHFVHGEIAPVPSILHSPSSLSSLSPLPGPYSSPRNDPQRCYAPPFNSAISLSYCLPFAPCILKQRRSMKARRWSETPRTAKRMRSEATGKNVEGLSGCKTKGSDKLANAFLYSNVLKF